MNRKVIFIPYVKADPTNTERTPKLLFLLSSWFEVVPIPPSKLDKAVYDQGGNKFYRYILFLLDEATIFLSVLRAGKREKVSLVFAEGSYFSLAGGFAARIMGIPLVWDNHGNIKDFSSTLGKSRFFVLGNLALERTVARMASAILVVSEKEVRTYSDLGFDATKFRVVPTCADMRSVEVRTRPRAEARKMLDVDAERKVVLFFGTLKYYPNRDAAAYIVKEMFPAVKAQVPEATVYIAGSRELGEEVPEGVVLLGFVPDLYLWLSAADVCVAPVWKGVGILTKVIDMMSAGRPTVVSPLALEGIPELEHGVNCLVGRDKESFAQEVVALLKDPAWGEEMGRSGRALIASKYSWDEVSPLLREQLESLLD